MHNMHTKDEEKRMGDMRGYNTGEKDNLSNRKDYE